ncbi:hypothetical protein [Lysinibacillus sp. 3P01SB]|uniref:hypothetical protein n=1 Tax=Lysinibacillus sp. 3P01SB TaxID=3132284 RepID=UPI0039A45CD7
MKLKIAPNDPQSMSQDGDAILRSLQNKSLPIIDLMVRESLQNSLDATLEQADVTKVNFALSDFTTDELAPHFEEISHELVNRYPGTQTALAISDKNTSGLTGDFTSEDQSVLDKSNFQKLIFGIGKNQDKEGAGGSWGLGKTSYFRMGAGIVVYYTRIKNSTGTGYEERLIASLIESPKQESRLLPKSVRGIAWWGEYDPAGSRIYPLTDPQQIQEILNIFNLSRYQDDETGTTIIIPFLKPAVEEEGKLETEIYPWEQSYEKAIRMAVQRWYSPRLMNEQYSQVLGNSKLDCSVNNMAIHPEINMEPVFKIFQDLYNAALTGNPVKDQVSEIKVSPIYLPKNALRNTKEPVGCLAFTEVSREDLKMTPPENKPAGLAYLGVRDKTKIESNISKVIAYSRKPGMIVEYSVDGEWAPAGLIQKEGHLILGFFVPVSNAVLIEKYEEMGYKNLENYLRATENADHANWVDEDGVGIIRRMKKYSSKAILESFQGEQNNGHTSATSALSRKYGALLMPPRNFGRMSRQKTKPGNGGGTAASKNRMSDIVIEGSKPIDAHHVDVMFRAFIKGEAKSTVSVQVLTQDQKLDKAGWEKVMGEKLDFPFLIQNVNLYSTDDEKADSQNTISSLDTAELVTDTSQTDKFEIISHSTKGVEVAGKIRLEVISNQYIPVITIRSEQFEKTGGE